MSEIESHAVARMREIDAKLDELTAEVAAFRAEIRTALDQLHDEHLVTSSICLARTDRDPIDLACQTELNDMSDMKASRHSGDAARADPFMAARSQAARDLARRQGLIRKGEKHRTISARMSEALVAEARRRTGITSDSELLEAALASLAVGAEFGEWLLAQRGRLPRDFQLEP